MIDINLMATNISDEIGKVPTIKKSYDHEPQSMTQFPASTLYFDGFSQGDDTTRRKNVDWNWIIRLYVPIRGSDITAPQKEIRTLIVDCLKQLRANPSLSDTCLWHTVSNGEVFAVLDQNNPVMVAELTLSATTEEHY